MADKGYHATNTIELADYVSLRTYIPELHRRHDSRWTDKSEDERRAVLNNRRRVRGAKSKRLQRRRSEVCERTFAHVCDSSGMRRSWLRGQDNVQKRYLMAAAAHNLGRVLWKLFGFGKPKESARPGSASGGTFWLCCAAGRPVPPPYPATRLRLSVHELFDRKPFVVLGGPFCNGLLTNKWRLWRAIHIPSTGYPDSTNDLAREALRKP